MAVLLLLCRAISDTDVAVQHKRKTRRGTRAFRRRKAHGRKVSNERRGEEGDHLLAKDQLIEFRSNWLHVSCSFKLLSSSIRSSAVDDDDDEGDDDLKDGACKSRPIVSSSGSPPNELHVKVVGWQIFSGLGLARRIS